MQPCLLKLIKAPPREGTTTLNVAIRAVVPRVALCPSWSIVPAHHNDSQQVCARQDLQNHVVRVTTRERELRVQLKHEVETVEHGVAAVWVQQSRAAYAQTLWHDAGPTREVKCVVIVHARGHACHAHSFFIRRASDAATRAGMPLHWVSPGCSWYEQHMLGGCQRLAAHRSCGPVKSVAATAQPTLFIVVPFRGSLEWNFETFCQRLPPYLTSQGIRFSLIVVNQLDAHPFNRAALVNVAYDMLVSGRMGLPFSVDDDYLSVHDVDRFPVLSNRSCAHHVSKYYTFPAQRPRVLHSESYTGGVVLIRGSHFQSVNGFSNSFWGWGHEDNDMYLRLRWCNLGPHHAEELDWCMEHRDCPECRRAKSSSTVDALSTADCEIEHDVQPTTHATCTTLHS